MTTEQAARDYIARGDAIHDAYQAAVQATAAAIDHGDATFLDAQAAEYTAEANKIRFAAEEPSGQPAVFGPPDAVEDAARADYLDAQAAKATAEAAALRRCPADADDTAILAALDRDAEYQAAVAAWSVSFAAYRAATT